MILLDTNVLGRMTHSADPHCLVACRAVDTLIAKAERLIVVPQNLYEFWAVATRKRGAPPAGQNGLGMTPEQASQWLQFFQRRFVFLPDREELFTYWHALGRSQGIKGVRSHDARLVAAMQTFGIALLLTFNLADFKDFAITLLDPSTLL
jgi:predicted nucleic acid-binding protein